MFHALPSVQPVAILAEVTLDVADGQFVVAVLAVGVGDLAGEFFRR